MDTYSNTSTIILAVLPAQNASGNKELDLFCTGLVIDLITDLSRFPSFNIISHNAVRDLDPDADIQSQRMTDLHADYVIKSLIRYYNAQLIITTQLINAKQGRIVWSEKFSGALDDLFRIQDELVEKIIGSLQHFVDYDLLGMLRKKPITTLTAYECWLQGYEWLKKGTIEADEKARTYFQKAIQSDPDYARAYTGMSLTYFNEWSCQLWDRWEISQKGAMEWARKAVDLDPRDHVSLAVLGRIHLFQGDYEKAEYYLRESFSLNPNDAENLVLIAYGLGFLSYPKEAFQLYEKICRLMPVANQSTLACGMFIHFELGEFRKAIELGERCTIGRGWVDFPAFLAAAYYREGDTPNAQRCWSIFLEEFSQKINGGKKADSKTALNWMISVNPYRGETQLRPFWEFMGNEEKQMTGIRKRSVAEREPCRFIHESGMWLLEFQGTRIRMTGTKGFHDLAALLSQPNTPIHCIQLMGTPLEETGVEVFDERARREYKERIAELHAELQEAEAVNDPASVATLKLQYENLVEHLSKGLGLGGKTRNIGSHIDKTRSAVTWRIRNAIRKIEEHHGPLGRHLSLFIKTGLVCVYTPETPRQWEV